MTQTDPIAEARIIIEGFVHDDPSLVVAAAKAWLASNPESKPAAGVTEDLDQIARDAIAFMQAFEEVDWDEGTITRASVAFKEGHRAALASAAPAASETIPAGYVLVPKEPTEAMTDAGMSTLPGPSDLCLADIEDIYVTMLRAAPAVSQPPADTRETGNG